ncbi:hypothetical protein ACFQ5J_06080 [Lacticaseibacillus baoqingensis]|uniref:Uncharacterized protein n=1 Tax=Lacticaseibacillus baoqingensis TaxID=2486013 RepID=A0ABW4E4H6_9LACO|nr:hypothetical protein [Lacticaseibacillus baoqingensis]
MAKYKVILHFSDGDVEDDNYGEFYSSKAEAESAGQEGLHDTQTGAEILNLSNPGDNPYDPQDFDQAWYEVVKVK